MPPATTRPAGAPVLDRLAGLETEYALRFHPDAPQDAPDDAASAGGRTRAGRPPAMDLFKSLVAELRRAIPLAEASYGKKGFFLANGGAVWHEVRRTAAAVGLVEGSTPECRGPRRLLAHQRAQDALLSAAARDTSAGGEVALCKSDRDAFGRVYGAQENYETTLAEGWRLQAWRCGLVLLVPAVAFAWIGVVAIALLMIPYFAAAGLVYSIVLGVAPRWMKDPSTRDRLGAALFGRGLEQLPPAFDAIAHVVAEVAVAPSALALSVLAGLFAFRSQRRQLLPFLVSRAIVGGSGRLAPDGTYHVAAKATGINCVAAVNEVFGRRPVFTFGHFIKALLLPGSRRPLRDARQRLQISLGDSNLCEEAEYLRVGTTMLVLDVIEAGEMPPVPRLRRPIHALRTIAADESLAARVRLSGGRKWTAIQIQRFYLDACREFLARRPDAPAEASALVRLWQDMLDRLETDPDSLVGRLDWVTKRFLLRRCGAGAPWAARKKIDLRYHELSPDGYFERLKAAGVVRGILLESEIESAEEQPPPDSPATERGRLIREHAGNRKIRVNWDGLTLG